MTMTSLEYRNILAEKLIRDFVKDFKYKTGLKIAINVSNDLLVKKFDPNSTDPIDEEFPIVTLPDIEKIVIFNYPYKMENDTLKCKCRRREFVDARSMFVHIARKFNFKLKTIAQYINRDHTSIIHLQKKADNLMETDRKFLSIYINITEKIKEKYDKVV